MENTIQSRLHESMKAESSFSSPKEKFLIAKIGSENNNNEFLNPKIFPLKRASGLNSSLNTSKIPQYCRLLNFDAEKYLIPANLNGEDRSNRIEVDGQGLIVKYVGPGRSDSDAAAIRSTLPVPPQAGIYYYEVKVINRGRDGFIAAGYAIKSASLGRLTGWEPGTIGYHADDGNLYRGAGTGSAFGPTYTANDTVGCGINLFEKSFFFTKNGVLIGEIGNLKDKFHLPFFPSVGCRTVGEVLALNFGTQKFVFDIESYILRKQKDHENFSNASVVLFNEFDLVLSYLVHCGYRGAAKAFMKEAILSMANSNQIQAADSKLEESFQIAKNRRAAIEALKTGKMALVGDLLRTHFPSFLMENVDLAFKLECLNFVELVRIHETETNSIEKEKYLNEIIENGRRLTHQFPPTVVEVNSKLLQDVLALLAYVKPSESPLNHLLQKTFRSQIADNLDLALLKHEGKSPISPLHHVLRQTQIIMDELQHMEDPEVALVNL